MIKIYLYFNVSCAIVLPLLDSQILREAEIYYFLTRSAGCVFAELMLGQPIFPGDSGVDQLVEIIKVY